MQHYSLHIYCIYSVQKINKSYIVNNLLPAIQQKFCSMLYGYLIMILS